MPPGDPVKLAYAVKRLVENPAMVKKLRHNALDTVRENYTHERIVDRVEAYFQEVLKLRNLSL